MALPMVTTSFITGSGAHLVPIILLMHGLRLPCTHITQELPWWRGNLSDPPGIPARFHTNGPSLHKGGLDGLRKHVCSYFFSHVFSLRNSIFNQQRRRSSEPRKTDNSCTVYIPIPLNVCWFMMVFLCHGL